jgi:orotate phosphoribosyltransferase
MQREDVLNLFRRSGALLEGHFKLSSGLHSAGYLQCALVLQDPRDAEALGRALADRVRHLRIEAVLSPAMGGIIIGHEVARALGVRAIFAERVEGRLALRRGFALKPGERVLVVEDVLTTGLSTRETIDVARGAGADIAGAAAIINRNPAATSGTIAAEGRDPAATPGSIAAGGRSREQEEDVPFAALADYVLPNYQPDACPLCAEGTPVVKPGSRGA